MRSVAMGDGVNKGADAVVGGREAIEAEIAMMVREALDELLRRSKAEEFDFDAAQQLLRRIGGRMVERAVVLNLRCFRLSPSRWTAFFHRHPGPRRSPVATLRKEAA